MTGGTPDEPARGKPPAPTTREVRLAEALRANLRRRKAAPKPIATGAEQPPPETD